MNNIKKLFLFIVPFFLHYHLKAQELYVGTNYHPHDDKNIEKIKRDIQLMKDAGFTVVRMGHLAWDSYEPSEGKFDFAWFDKVMDLMNEAGIKVILDIAIRPAPVWLHHRYPSIDIVDANGDKQYPNHRYMEDVGDSIYQKFALRYADALIICPLNLFRRLVVLRNKQHHPIYHCIYQFEFRMPHLYDSPAH